MLMLDFMPIQNNKRGVVLWRTFWSQLNHQHYFLYMDVGERIYSILLIHIPSSKLKWNYAWRMPLTNGGHKRKEHGFNWWGGSRNEHPHDLPGVIILVCKTEKRNLQERNQMYLLMNIGDGDVLFWRLVKVYLYAAALYINTLTRY